MAGKLGGLLNSYMKYNYRSTVSTVKETRKRMINNGFGTPQSTESVSENFVLISLNIQRMFNKCIFNDLLLMTDAMPNTQDI